MRPEYCPPYCVCVCVCVYVHVCNSFVSLSTVYLSIQPPPSLKSTALYVRCGVAVDTHAVLQLYTVVAM